MYELHSITLAFFHRCASLSLATVRHRHAACIHFFAKCSSSASFPFCSFSRHLNIQKCPRHLFETSVLLLIFAGIKALESEQVENSNGKKFFLFFFVFVHKYQQIMVESKRFRGWSTGAMVHKFGSQSQLIHFGYYQILSSAVALTALKMETNVVERDSTRAHSLLYRFGCRC